MAVNMKKLKSHRKSFQTDVILSTASGTIGVVRRAADFGLLANADRHDVQRLLDRRCRARRRLRTLALRQL